MKKYRNFKSENTVIKCMCLSTTPGCSIRRMKCLSLVVIIVKMKANSRISKKFMQLRIVFEWEKHWRNYFILKYFTMTRKWAKTHSHFNRSYGAAFSYQTIVYPLFKLLFHSTSTSGTPVSRQQILFQR